MRNLFLSLALVLSSFLNAQTIQEADLTIDLIISDNATPPNNGSWEITFGLDSTATDGLDTHLGESYVPPDGCCGWGTGLCAAFQLPTNPNSVWIDYRFAELPYSIITEHRIWYCANPSSTVITIQCNLPEGVSAQLQDLITGNLIYIEMTDSNEYYITNFIGIGLKLTVNYHSIIPVELISFTANASENTVNLNWQTATETNNSGFEIERRKTIDESSEEWNTIGFIIGSGTTTQPQSYSFVDENLSSGRYKYRLKQIDYDGTFTYLPTGQAGSNEIEVEITPSEFALEQNYPNPFNPSTTINYTIPTPPSSSPLAKGRNEVEFVTLKVYDVLGNEIATLVNEEKTAGSYVVEFNVAQDSRPAIASGIYFYKLQAGEFVQTKKMLLLK